MNQLIVSNIVANEILLQSKVIPWVLICFKGDLIRAEVSGGSIEFNLDLVHLKDDYDGADTVFPQLKGPAAQLDRLYKPGTPLPELWGGERDGWRSVRLNQFDRS